MCEDDKIMQSGRLCKLKIMQSIHGDSVKLGLRQHQSAAISTSQQISAFVQLAHPQAFRAFFLSEVETSGGNPMKNELPSDWD